MYACCQRDLSSHSGEPGVRNDKIPQNRQRLSLRQLRPDICEMSGLFVEVFQRCNNHSGQ